MKNKNIKVINATENNLKNICDRTHVPKNHSRKWNLDNRPYNYTEWIDVLYNEGRRRYVDSLSNYAKQFLGGTSKPKVESIEGLSPAIAIDQKTTSNNPRSTVGTVTEIYDFYRLLFSRIGKPFCPNHNIEISARPISSIVNQVINENNETSRKDVYVAGDGKAGAKTIVKAIADAMYWKPPTRKSTVVS